jgi:hypothetical protein
MREICISFAVNTRVTISEWRCIEAGTLSERAPDLSKGAQNADSADALLSMWQAVPA